MIRRCAMLMLLLMVAACAHARETSAPVAEGRRVFQDQGCYGCHAVGQTGTPIGPDLSHIGAKHFRIGIVLFSQRLDNRSHCSSIAARNNLLSCFV